MICYFYDIDFFYKGGYSNYEIVFRWKEFISYDF